jgi:signal transduction histidine kinase
VFCQERIVAVVGVANKESEYNDSDVRQLNLMMDAVWKIVQRKQAESERKSLQDQLLQAQKLESLGRLAGGVAHDFNNMLGVILGYAELTLQQMDANQPLSANLHEIRKAAERSAHLTRQLLAFARKQAVSPRVLDLNETVEGMLKMLRRLIGEDIDLTWMPGRNLWPVRVDPAQIDQILANLCVNARDAISGVGRITIETDAVRFDGRGATTAAAWTARPWATCSSPFSPPRRWAGGPVWAWPPSTGSSSRIAALSTFRANRTRGRPSGSTCRGMTMPPGPMGKPRPGAGN